MEVMSDGHSAGPSQAERGSSEDGENVCEEKKKEEEIEKREIRQGKES